MPETKPELSTLDYAYIGGAGAVDVAYPDSGTAGVDGVLQGGAPYTAPSWNTSDTLGRQYVSLPGPGNNATAGFNINCPRITLPITDSFATNLTVAAWLRMSASATGSLWLTCQDGTSTTTGFRLIIDGVERLDSYVKTARTWATTGIGETVWRHVAVVMPLSGLGRLYVGGIEVGAYYSQQTLPTSIGNAIGRVSVGITDYAANYRICMRPLDIADLIIAKRVLSTDEIQWLANPANTYSTPSSKQSLQPILQLLGA